MIPKIIHFCWLSGDKYPDIVARCIKSWHKFLPDYEIKCWDSKSFDFNSVKFVKEAYENKKWAFVSDYIRLYALYTEGGIYLDSDVRAFGPIDDWLQNDFFTGIEKRNEHSELYIEAAIMGASKENRIIKKALDMYAQRHFVQEDGSFDMTPIPTMITPILCDCYGWRRVNETQKLPNNAVVYSLDLISNSNSAVLPTTRLYHLNNRSWIPRTRKEKLYKTFNDLGLIPVWNFFKRLRSK